jgi:hypothetical protein
MKAITQTIIVTIALSLLSAGLVPANNVSGEEIQSAAVELQAQKAQLEKNKADLAVALAQAQISQPAAPVLPTTPAPTVPPESSPSVAASSPSVAAVERNIYELTDTLSFGSQAGSGDMVLVIPSEQTRMEDLIAINEDMNVMSRIFETNLEQGRITTARSGIFVSRRDPFGTLLGGSRGEIQSMYLQGYGALFLLKVDFPLSPSSDVQEEEKEPKKEEQGDPVWQQMRREIYEPENVSRRHKTDRPEEKFDPEKVENLKTTLIKILKHATNIRSLKPDESVVLTVTGSGGSTGTKVITATRAGENQVLVQQRDSDGKMITKLIQGTAKELNDIGLSSPMILVIRAKRSEIDAFAKGELDFDKFRGRVQVLTYPLLGGALGSFSSPSQNIGLY